jgi:polysaccharide export outer membrane protein
MPKILINSILFLIIILFSGCSIKEYKLFQNNNSNTKDDNNRVINMITDKEYSKELKFENTIAPNDRVSIIVYVQSGFGKQEMTSILTVRDYNNEKRNPEDIGKLVAQDGTVRLPLIDKVSILGLTEDGAANKIINSYKKYIRNPYVTVEIKNQRVIVIGEVKKPGVVPVTNGTMNIIEAIARSGDLTDYASRTNIKIIRGDLRKPQVRNIDLTNILAINSTSLSLQPNDIIYVQPRNMKGINRAFKEINPFWNMLSSILDPFTQRKELID